MKKITSMLMGMAMLGSFATANAASVWLEPTSSTINIGDPITFDLHADFTDGGFSGGAIDILFNSSVLDFVGFTLASIPGYFTGSSGPTDCGVDPSASSCSGPDQLTTLAFFSLNFGTGFDGAGVLGQLVFNGAAAGFSSIMLRDDDAIGGGWIAAADGVTPIDVSYIGAEVTVVPLPAAAWLMLGGLGMLLGFGKQRKQQAVAA